MGLSCATPSKNPAAPRSQPPAQWAILQEILGEIDAANAGKIAPDTRPGRPNPFRGTSHRLRIRRIYHPDGWTLKFTGKEATGALMEDIMDEVERMVGGG